jgi:hypothetical protein
VCGKGERDTEGGGHRPRRTTAASAVIDPDA